MDRLPSDDGKEKNAAQRGSPYLTGQDLRASSLGWEIAVPIMGGPILGHYLDKRFHTGIELTITFLVLGIMAASFFIFRYIAYENDLLNPDDEEEDDDD